MEQMIILKILVCIWSCSFGGSQALPLQRNGTIENRTFDAKMKVATQSMVAFQDCGSIYDILQLSISGCQEAPCQMPLGDSVQVNAEFNDYGEDVHVLRHYAYWVLNSVNTKAAVTPESCDGNLCPFRGFEGMAFTAALFVNNTLPALRGTLFWEVYNQSEERVMCYKIPISLKY